jgi:hypothetical protein
MLLSPRSVWVRQAAVHLLWRDDFVGIADAVDMATAIWQRRPWVLALPPEKVVDEILDGKAEDDQTPLALPAFHRAHDWAA